MALWQSTAKEGKRERETRAEKRQKEKEMVREQGEREGRDIIRARWERDFMFALDKPFIAHTKESNAVIDNYLDSIYLISPK